MVETKMFDPKKPSGPDGSLQIGSVLQGRYKITGVLGVGGMGSVYLARDMHFPTVTRNVAVKEMLNLSTDPTHREITIRTFERESNILAELSHPAIPKIYDYFSNKERAYLVMEFINGKDLEAIVNSMPDFIPFEMVKKWALELCDVLSYLHQHQPEPIIFRDMKPSNVMIDSQGKVRLIDFGIAKTFTGGDNKGTQIGTEGYSPPEQYKGEATPSGDVYALGATLHHILTRKDPRLEPPFSFPERPLKQLNPNIPDWFIQIMNRALSYNASERFPTALAMKEAIEAAERGAAAAAVASAGTAATRGEGGSSGQPGLTNGFSAAGQIMPIWTFRAEDEIRSTPVAHKGLVYVGTYDNNIYALSVNDGSFKWKFPTEGGVVGTPAVAAEEGILVFGSEDKSLYTIDLRTGKINWTFQTGGPIRSSVQISHGHAFFGSDDGKLYAVRLTNGRLAWKLDFGSPIRTRPAVTDERIVFGMESGEVIGLDLTGAIKWRYKTKRAVHSSPIVIDNVAYFGSMDWHIYAVDAQTGFAIWRVRTGSAIVGAPLVIGRTAYIASADNHLYAFDTQLNGREIWKFKTEGQVVATPVFANGAVYFGGVDQNFYCLDMKKGQLRWKFQTGGPIAASACVIDNIICFGSTDHILYALNL